MRAISPALLCAIVFTLPLLAERPNISQPENIVADVRIAPEAADVEVKVCLGIDAVIDFQTLLGSERTAGHLFDGTGVRVRWGCGHGQESARNQIVVRLTDRTGPDFLKGALGYALPFAHDGVRVTIFYDRVDQLQRDRDCRGILLGHTIAHELAHVLEGEDAHAPSGIMRPRWDDRDFRAMRMNELNFSPEDIRAIRRNLSAFAPQ